MRVAIITHPRRRDMAEQLKATLGTGKLFIDTDSRGAAWNHWRAIDWAQTQDRVLILEDDAIPCPDLLERAEEWTARYPSKLISFYLGRGAPVSAQPTVDRLIREAEAEGHDFITHPDLLHAVAYTIPAWVLPHLRLPEPRRRLATDVTIGQAWRAATRSSVLYTLPSLVDHADGEGIHEHAGRRPAIPRRAWRI